jgi:hypothetical protein
MVCIPWTRAFHMHDVDVAMLWFPQEPHPRALVDVIFDPLEVEFEERTSYKLHKCF